MNEWEIIRKWKVPAGAPAGGSSSQPERQWRYQVEHTESGEVKTVATWDEYDLGDRLSDADFEDIAD
jgi:hypothetical protein